MDLETELLQQINDSALTCNERAWLRCELAKKLEEAGNYDGAQAALGDLWQRVSDRSQVEGLDERTTAEVRLRVGVLVGWVGSTRQVDGAQEKAKNFITESITLFEKLQDTKKVAEALTELGYCYLREGALNEARVVLKDALARLGDAESELKAIILLRSAVLEKEATRYNDALRLHDENAPLVDASSSYALKGKFHNEFGAVLMLIGQVEHREDYKDRAFVEYAAASFHFEQAGHVRYHACVENNLGFLFFTASKFPEAHEHLEYARRLLSGLKDKIHVAQVDETRARVFLAEGKNTEAARIARSAVEALEGGGQQHLLAEALTTLGTALARLSQRRYAGLTFQSAMLIAEQAGDREGAGQATLTALEELSETFTVGELAAMYERAADLLATSQLPSIPRRLNECARLVCRLFAHDLESTPTPARSSALQPKPIGSREPKPPPAPSRVVEHFEPSTEWEGFRFWEEVERYEAYLIRRALRKTRGVLSRAAALLGVTHQTLESMLKRRHKNLYDLRTPPASRRKSIIRLRETRHNADLSARQAAQVVTILHAEDHALIANMVRDLIESAGWRVVTCTDGADALARLTSQEDYDLLLLDNNLPNVSGVELARCARALPHRRQTPIIMLSATDIEAEAIGAGVDVFLLKPGGAAALFETINQMLNRSDE